MEVVSEPKLPYIPDDLAWKPEFQSNAGALDLLNRLVEDGPWNGPLIVSMPRTGSTLLATIFLLACEPPGSGDFVFDRYIHEPVAPLFWENRPVSSILEVAEGRLTPRDIVQESAYQFASKDIGRWFMHRARQPIAFTMRHPQISWPSRWRIMLREWLAAQPDAKDAARFREALDKNHFSNLGDALASRITQPDNGWYAFASLLQLCEEDGIDFVLVDNGRFRSDPDTILGGLSQAWGIGYDEALTSWQNLDAALPRIVMSDLAAGPEYDWYYARTLGSTGGIIRTDKPPLSLDRFPEVLRGRSDEHLTIDQAVSWYETLLQLPQTLG